MEIWQADVQIYFNFTTAVFVWVIHVELINAAGDRRVGGFIFGRNVQNQHLKGEGGGNFRQKGDISYNIGQASFTIHSCFKNKTHKVEGNAECIISHSYLYGTQRKKDLNMY